MTNVPASAVNNNNNNNDQAGGDAPPVQGQGGQDAEPEATTSKGEAANASNYDATKA